MADICGYDTSLLRDSFERVRRELEAAAKDSPTGKPPLLLAATKTVPVEVINYAAENLGLTDIGENRVDELLEKYDRLDPNLKVHFIGALQTNKVKHLIGRVSMIHSVDSEHLAREIGKAALKAGTVMDVLLEINIGREENKRGVMPEAAMDEMMKISEIEGILVKGVMTMAPKCEKKADYQKYFAETRRIFLDIEAKKLHNIIDPVLSMGMSDSYVEAAREGATIVRVGTALFGHRHYQ
ncbi:MAG: YggS family pyridoxal phosphate-dependent enzyme [Firmicutes bacterium]|nr:YggS family pyridoxal phosphate-dependent enzyme [Bacillota bacterium]